MILPELPTDMLDLIFKLLDDQSLLNLRMVCKVTKAQAEMTVLRRNKNPAIDRLKLSEQDDGDIAIEFSFDRVDRKDRLSCKLYAITAVNCHQLPVFCLDDRKKMFTTMSATDTTTFFDQLTSVMDGMTCTTLELCPSTPKMFSLTSNFFDGKTVPELGFKMGESNESRAFLIQLILLLNSTAVRLELITYVSDEFLLRLAEIVDAISISANSTNWIVGAVSFVVSIEDLAFNILKSRCSYFDLSKVFFSMTKPEAYDLHTRLKGATGSRPFYFAALTHDKICEFNYKDYTIAVVENVNNYDLLEIKYKQMTRRKW